MKIGRLKGAFASNALHRQRYGGEVQSQSVGKARGLQVTADDREVDILKVFDCLALNDDLVVCKKIEPVLANLMIAIEERDALSA